MHDYKDIDVVLKLIEQAQEVDSDQRDAARDAVHFISKKDGQWEADVVQQSVNRPRYTFDKCTPIVDQISGEIDNAEFTLRVMPAGGEASKDTAKTYDGLIRNIRNISNAEHIFSAAARNMVACGVDGWEIVQDWVDADAFDQDLFIRKIHNFTDRVWFDPSSEEQDHSDANWVVVLSTISHEAYKAQFPEGSSISITEQRTYEAYDHKPEAVIIGKILYKKPRNIEIVRMSNGAVYKVDDKFEAIKDELAQAGVVEEARRTRKSHRVYSRIFDGKEYLTKPEETVFDFLPVVATYGNYSVVENKRIFRGVVDKLMDAQRVYNYAASRMIEEGALAPRGKYWMTREQAAKDVKKLATMNTNTDPVQTYSHVEGVQPPFFQGGAVINPGLQQTAMQASEDLSASAGLFAANMGDNPGLQSGVAIEQQISKGDNGTTKWFLSQEVAIAYTGKVLINAIPRVYDATRTVRILQEDGSHEMANLNTTVPDQQTGQMVEINNLASGQYDVLCESGLAFKSKQKETSAAFAEIAAIDPTVMELAGDVWYNNLNTPGMNEVSERKRAMMIQQGIIPEEQWTEEEAQKIQAEQEQAAQEEPQEDPMMVAAQAEMLKAQAEMKGEENKAQEIQVKMQEAQIKGQLAQVSMQEVQIKGQDSERKNSEIQLSIAKLQQEQQKIETSQEIDTHGANLKTREQEIKIAEVEAEIMAKKAKAERDSAEAAQTIAETEAMAKGMIKLMKAAQARQIGNHQPKATQ